MKKIVLSLFLMVGALFISMASAQSIYAATSSNISLRFENNAYHILYNNDYALPGGTHTIDMVEEGLGTQGVGFQAIIGEWTSQETYTYSGEQSFTEIQIIVYPDESIGVTFVGTGVSYWMDIRDTAIASFKTAPFDNVRPAFSGQENFVTSVDDARPLSFFRNYIYAYDETDGDITDNIYIVSDDYTPNMDTLGKYEVIFAVEDSAGNETTLVTFINVVDITDPVIQGNTSIAEISYTQTYNISAFKSTLTATDNYYTLTSSNITVLSDDYTPNKDVPGTYDIVFEVTDPSGNQGTFTKQIRVIDDVAPIFSGPTVITKPSNSILAVSEIQAQLTAHDAIEGSKTGQITVLSDSYTGNGNVVGSYDVVFQVQDSKGNKSTHTVTVNVVDNIAPIIYIKDGVSIILKADEVLTREQIISILQVTGQVQNVTASTQFSFLIDEYQGNEETPGVYMMSVRATSASGNQSVHNMMINVLEADTDDDVTVEPVTLKWYEHIWNFIVGVWNFIVNVFISIWNFFVGIFDWFVELFTSSNEASLAYKFYNRF